MTTTKFRKSDGFWPNDVRFLSFLTRQSSTNMRSRTNCEVLTKSERELGVCIDQEPILDFISTFVSKRKREEPPRDQTSGACYTQYRVPDTTSMRGKFTTYSTSVLYLCMWVWARRKLGITQADPNTEEMPMRTLMAQFGKKVSQKNSSRLD